ncbi:hypothetical protein HDU90_002190 [Geranomyces variabilis]|nr:hypothetical protein HDU90_002190 [Geranomyces variabilis]
MADAEANIAELAQESKQKDRQFRLPPIPLVILAPLLVICALIAVTVPSFIVLNKASSDTTDLLSSEYLESLLNNVKVQAEEPVRKLEPLVEGMMRNPALISTFNGPFTNMATSAAAPLLLSMGDAYNLASLACYSARWKSGYDLVNDKFEWLTAVDHVVIQDVYYAGTRFLGVTEPGISMGVDTNGGSYINQTGYPYYPFTYVLVDPNRQFMPVYSFTYAIEPEMPPATLEMLGKASSAVDYNSTSFSISYFANGWTVGYVSRVHFPQNDASKLPDFACAAGLRVDDQWNSMLRELKPPVADSVVAIYDQEFAIIASSNMHVDDSSLTGGALFNKATPDAFTISVQSELKTRYTTGANALTAIGGGTGFTTSLQGRSWVLNSAVIDMTFRDTDRFILVVAVPHSEIYGVIESAKKRSLGLSIGIAVAMALLIGAVFVAITLPMARLAAQMALLTTLNFGTLETSGALDRRSFIWELRRVQATFATMVKAFAGQLKKNRALMMGATGTSSVGNNGGGTAGTGKRPKTATPGIRETAPLMSPTDRTP